MSFQTWKAEFYPLPAEKATGSMLEAIEHSIKKLEGFRPENLEKHKVTMHAGSLGVVDLQNKRHAKASEAVDHLPVTSSTCALCRRCYDEAQETRHLSCDECPVYAVHDSTPCDMTIEGEKFSPFLVMTRFDNPEPMLALLYKARELEKEFADEVQDDQAGIKTSAG